VNCHPERSEGPRFLPAAATLHANTQVPHFVRDDNIDENVNDNIEANVDDNIEAREQPEAGLCKARASAGTIRTSGESDEKSNLRNQPYVGWLLRPHQIQSG
jgi:hypothetical protein